MATNPTVIAASLNDQELRKSIDSLVQYVKDQTGAMSKAFDDNVQKMENAIKNLGSQKGSSSKSSNNKATEDVTKLKTATQEATKATEDLGKAMQRASGRATVLSAEAQKQLQIIRESKQWQETGIYSQGAFANHPLYNPERLQGTKAHVKEIGDLEQQYLAAQKQITKEAALQVTNIREEVALGNVAVTQAQQQVIKTAENLAFHERILRVRQEAENTKARRANNPTDTDYLREQLASLLGVQTKEIQLTNIQKASYNDLARELKTLQAAYNKLGADLVKSEGKDIAQRIRLVTRAMQEMKKEASRPASLTEVLGHPEKTLDQINYKMQQLKAYMGGLDWRKQATEVKSCELEYSRLQKKQNELLGQNARLLSSNNTLARSWTYMKNRLAFYLTVGATTSFVRQLAEVRGQYEMTEKALGVLIGSAQRGTQVFHELSEMALISPYTLIELSNAARQLTAYGVEAKDLVDTTRRLADVAAAVGAPIENIAYALGHVQSYGYLTSLQARQFANNGIPLVKELSKRYTELEGRVVSVSDVYDRMKKKQVEYNDVMGVLNSMTDEGGRFFDFQAKMAETLKVQLANLTLAWNNMLNDMGKSNQSLFTAPIKGLKVMFQNWETLSRLLWDVVVVLGMLKTAQFAVNVIQGASATMAKKQALADKEVVAAQLRRKAMTKQLSMAEKRLLVSTKQVTAADYENALAGKRISATQAQVMVAFNRTNVALHKALINLGLLNKAQVESALKANRLRLVFTALGLSIAGFGKTLASVFMKNWFTILIFAVTDLILYMNRLNEKQRELNKNIADGAKEAAKSLREFMRTFNDTMDISTASQAKKSWEEIKGQIETSSAAGSYFIQELEKIPDAAQRVTTAINWVERIEQANDALSDLYDELDIAEDTWLGGLFGEGLAEDLQDLGEDMKKMSSGTIEEYTSRMDVLRSNLKEAQYEMNKFGTEVERVLRLKLTPEQLADPIIVREALEQIRTQVKMANPKIQGEAAKFFDVEYDLIMAEKLGKVVDSTATITKLITDDLKKKYSTAFQDVADGSEELSDKQIKILQKVGEDIRRTLPKDGRAAFDALYADMTSRDWAIRIRIAFDNGIVKSNLQKELENYFLGNDKTPKGGSKESPYQANQKKYGTYLLKQNESTEEHHKRLNEEFDKQNSTLAEQNNILKNITDTDSERYKAAKATKQEATEAIAAIQEIGLFSGYGKIAGKKTGKKTGRKNGRQTKPEDEIANALRDELSLIKEMQSNYDKLRKAGVDSTTALTYASSGYEETLKRINTILRKYGIEEFKASDFVGRDAADPNVLLRALQKQRQDLLNSGKVKTTSLKALDVEIQKVNVTAKEYNMQMLTDSLTNQLSKIKDEYELALELDSDPELGNAFADMFGIDTQSLPKSFKDMLSRIQEAVATTLVSLGEEHGKQYSPFNVMQDNLENWAKTNEISADSPLYKAMENAQKNVRDTFKKNLVDTEKMLDDYVKKYGDYSDKVAEIESNRLDRIKKLNEAYYTDRMRQSADYQAKLDAIEQGAVREKGQLKWQDFKESDLYVKMFENIQYTSTGVLQTIRQKLQDLRSELGELNPEQVKQIAEQMEKIDSELIKRNPYKNFTKTVREGIKALKERKVIQQQYAKAENAYTEQRDIVADTEVRLEAAKRKGNEEEILQLEQELAVEKEVLEVLGKQRNESALLNEKNRQALKDFGETFQAISNDFTSFTNAAVEIRDTLADVGVVFGDDINGAIDGMAQASQGFGEIVSSAMAGNIFGVVAGGIKSLIGTGKTFVSLFGGGMKDYFSGMKESVEEFAAILDKASSKIQQTMEASTGAKAAAQYKKLRDYNKVLEDSYRDLAAAAGRSGSSAGSHSYAVRTNRRLSGEWERISKIVGQTVDEVQDLYRLSPEQLSDLLTMAPDVWKQITPEIRESLEGIIDAGEKAVEYAEAFKEALTGVTFSGLKSDLENMLVDLDSSVEGAMEDMDEKVRRAAARQLLQGYDDRINKWVEEYNALWETDNVSDEALNAKVAEYERLMEELFKRRDAMFEQLGVADEEKKLSALQQGIQGITEDTAGALEGYMNGVSQQVYYQSDVLTQIRDCVIGFDIDMQNGIMSQMLLQMQQSYQVQMAIQNILVGWSNPSGQAVRVEMI